jgi:tetratricopeptide (TPR) repeat protein
MTENYFNSLKKYLKGCTSDEEYRVITNMDHVYSSIFLLSKEGELHEAEKELKMADQEYHKSVTSTQIKDHVNIVRQPIVAYLFFKQGHFDKAETLLEESIDASHNLEKEKSSFLLKMYQVQQYHNYARILFKKQEYNAWIKEMKRVLDYSLNQSLTLTNEETLVYVGMIDQLISEVIKFSDILKEERYLQSLLKNLKFKHPLFKTNEVLMSIKNWSTIKTKIHKFEIDFVNESKDIEKVLYDDILKKLYKKNLLKSIVPYLKDKIFLNYLSIIKNEKLIC